MEEAKVDARTASAEHAGSASLYRHLCHMSEANSLSEDLGQRTRYRPHRKERTRVGSKVDEVVCRIYEDGELTTEVPLPFFERRFKSLQARWNQLVVSKADKQPDTPAKGSKGRASLHHGGKASQASAKTSDAARHSDGGARPSGKDDQDALQRQIKRVTLETLALADKMWHQLDVLEKDSRPVNPFVIH